MSFVLGSRGFLWAFLLMISSSTYFPPLFVAFRSLSLSFSPSFSFSPISLSWRFARFFFFFFLQPFLHFFEKSDQ